MASTHSRPILEAYSPQAGPKASLEHPLKCSQKIPYCDVDAKQDITCHLVFNAFSAIEQNVAAATFSALTIQCDVVEWS